MRCAGPIPTRLTHQRSAVQQQQVPHELLSGADFVTSTLRFLHRRVLKPSCPIIKRAAASKLKERLSEGSAVPPSGSGLRPNDLPHIPNEVRAGRQQEEQGGNKGRDLSGHSWAGTGLCDTCKSKAKGLTPLPPHYHPPNPPSAAILNHCRLLCWRALHGPGNIHTAKEMARKPRKAVTTGRRPAPPSAKLPSAPL